MPGLTINRPSRRPTARKVRVRIEDQELRDALRQQLDAIQW
jgi:hypothetical protein